MLNRVSHDVAEKLSRDHLQSGARVLGERVIGGEIFHDASESVGLGSQDGKNVLGTPPVVAGHGRVDVSPWGDGASIMSNPLEEVSCELEGCVAAEIPISSVSPVSSLNHQRFPWR